MTKPKLKVGHYYELKIDKNKKIAFGVMYGFDSGKNKDVYALMIYTKNKIFEFPIQKNLFDEWVKEGRVKGLTSDEALVYVI
ncbi:MAG: hypothetical protein JXA91_00495 [Candidatus Thermoplasmatota archaeon]|nr:hypothetical protein [Candidatus Thermoplasmatota archaeon]